MFVFLFVCWLSGWFVFFSEEDFEQKYLKALVTNRIVLTLKSLLPLPSSASESPSLLRSTITKALAEAIKNNNKKNSKTTVKTEGDKRGLWWRSRGGPDGV